MKSKWIRNLSKIIGVESVVLVDKDGLIISSLLAKDDSVGHMASLSALTTEKIVLELNNEKEVDWQYIQCETEDVIILQKNMGIGLLVVVMSQETDLTEMQTEIVRIHENIRRTFTFDKLGMAGDN